MYQLTNLLSYAVIKVNVIHDIRRFMKRILCADKGFQVWVTSKTEHLILSLSNAYTKPFPDSMNCKK